MKSSFFCLLLLFCLKVNAQIPDYYVYWVKGNVFLERPDRNKIKLQQNAFLYSKDMVEVTDHSSIQIVNKDGDYLEFDVPGSFPISQYSSKLQSSAPGITKTYLKLVWEELLEPRKGANSAKQIGGAVGGVKVRGGGCATPLFPYNGSRLPDTIVIFRWMKGNTADDYHVQVGLRDSILLNIAVKDTFCRIDLHKFEKNDSLYWKVYQHQGCNDDHVNSFVVNSRLENQKMVTFVLDSFWLKELPEQLKIIDRLRHEGFLDEADSHFRRLVDLHPKNTTLRTAYEEFRLMLISNQISPH